MIDVLRHFSLLEAPFALTPNPHLYFSWEHTQAILSGSECALLRGDGILHIGGALGSGKTLLCRLLLAQLDTLGFNTAYLNAPIADPAQLPALVMQEFGIKPDPVIADYRTLGTFLLREFGRGRRSVLVIDEAQALGPRGLECLRLLSNLETDAHKLLHIVMFGPPELGLMFMQPDMQHIAQRISFSLTTKPLPGKYVGDYLRFRLHRCTDDVFQADIFDAAAIDLLTTASQGWPRLINLLADKAMLAAYADGSHRVTRQHLRLAITDTGHLSLPLPWRDRLANWRRAA